MSVFYKGDGGMALAVCLVITLAVSAAHCGSHTLQYYVAVSSTAYPGLLQYSIIAYVDDVRYGRYNSDTRRCESLIQSPMVFSEHLDGQTNMAQQTEITQKVLMNLIIDLLNKTYDINYVIQTKAACVLHEDGTVDVYEEVALDGKELVVFDKERVEFVPATQKAVLLAQWLNKQAYAMEDKIFMENECTQHLTLYLPYIKSYLDKKVPCVKLSSSESESGTELHCRVYGFYPRDVEVKWIKNGRDEIHSEEAAQILPNPDGTYQIRVSVGVTLDKNSNYSCLVDHSSLETPMIVTFVPNNGRHLYFIISASVILGIFIYRKRMTKDSHGSHEPVSISGESLNTDAHPKAQEEQITDSPPEGLENSNEILRKVEKRDLPFYIKQVLKPQ